ncbi:elongin-C-like isoform X6 [Chenopodium quinoa]|uniref:elongin-C-like isoform X6 n=1 Tax=Chenopodium quinoa TaxID=63459 RepID=UPI000B76E973|nr:elongin-C-like isoform X6 [Chenopodium quinoa]
MEKEETVKLISSEGFEFVIDRKAAMVSQFLRNLLTSPGNFAETENGIVRFPDISTTILEKICQYFYWSLERRPNSTLNLNLLWI